MYESTFAPKLSDLKKHYYYCRLYPDRTVPQPTVAQDFTRSIKNQQHFKEATPLWGSALSQLLQDYSEN